MSAPVLDRLTDDAARFTRRGACPALSAPMQTGDGLLVRLNPVSGGVSPAILIGLCDAALRHGNGIIEITARGSLQLRGLTAASATTLAGEVDTLGIAVRTGVPVQTGPLAGLDPDERANPSGLAEAIRKNIRMSGLEGRLGPKVSVVVDGGGRSELDDVAGDVRLTATEDGRWRVAVAGDAATGLEIGVFTEDAAAEVTLALLRAVADMGIAARGRDLSGEQIAELLGLSQDDEAVPVIPPPLTPPLKGEGDPLADTLRETVYALKPPETHVVPPPPRGEGSGVGVSSPAAGRAEGGAGADPADPITLIATFALTDTRTALGIALPFGSTDATTLRAFAAEAQALGAEELRFAPGRTLLTLCPTPEAASTLRKQAKSLGFIISPTDPRLHVSACPGAPACASGLISARDLAATVAAGNAALLDGSIDLHVSGCAKGCAHPATADLTVVGIANAAGIVVGGTARQVPLAYTAPDRAEHALAEIAALVSRERQDGETAAAVLKRLVPQHIAEAFGKR